MSAQIGIIGGGASGVLAAIHLLRQRPAPHIHIFNDRCELGRGIAYTPRCDQLVLNVRVGSMSAFPEMPTHFSDWLGVRRPGRFTADCFVPRKLYGDYLQETLNAAANSAEGHLHAYAGRVNRIEAMGGGYQVHRGDDKPVVLDKIILALGNTLPANPDLADTRFGDDPRFISNVWQESFRLQGIGTDEPVVILGAGLTAVDAVLQLRDQGHRGKIDVLSRRGQWPSLHIAGIKANAVAPPDLVDLGPVQALRKLRVAIRDWEKAGGNWRHVVDALRPQTNAIWAAWNLDQKRRFLRHLRPYWDSHRHRTCPEIWTRLYEQLEIGSLEIQAARIVSIVPDGGRLTVTYRARGSDTPRTIQASHVLNCTGSETLQRKNCQPVVQSLIEDGIGQLDPLGLGLVTAASGALLNANGEVVPNLYAIGPTRRGTLWETTAVPEIRAQAAGISKVMEAREMAGVV